MSKTPSLRVLNSTSCDFDRQLEHLTHIDPDTSDQIQSSVRNIVGDVRRRGDPALLEYTKHFDQLPDDTTLEDLTASPQALQEAFTHLPAPRRNALQFAADRIRAYHQRQLAHSWEYEDEQAASDIRLGQQITPLDRVGLYVPGGQAAYPSSVLMNAIPAKVAAVGELIMTTPTPRGIKNPLVLAAAWIAGVDQVIFTGGAQAIAAMAYGTQRIRPVDKIVGPGNAYVAEAKRLVFGTVGIDMIAGPSEVLIISDAGANPDWLAMDLFAQAEHDELAQSILISPCQDILDQTQSSIQRLLPDMPRRDIISASLGSRAALIRVRDLDEAAAVSNRIAPEHLQLAIQNPKSLLPAIRHAGAIFLGYYASESLGDYCAGPNHVLPTQRSARFSSPLGVYDFQKRSSVIHIGTHGARMLGPACIELAESEGLSAHAHSARMRLST